MSNTNECAICLATISNCTALDGCSHQFCFGCIDKWLQVTSLCPLCKSPVTEIRRVSGKKFSKKIAPQSQRAHWDTDELQRLVVDPPPRIDPRPWMNEEAEEMPEDYDSSAEHEAEWADIAAHYDGHLFGERDEALPEGRSIGSADSVESIADEEEDSELRQFIVSDESSMREESQDRSGSLEFGNRSSASGSGGEADGSVESWEHDISISSQAEQSASSRRSSASSSSSASTSPSPVRRKQRQGEARPAKQRQRKPATVVLSDSSDSEPEVLMLPSGYRAGPNSKRRVLIDLDDPPVAQQASVLAAAPIPAIPAPVINLDQPRKPRRRVLEDSPKKAPIVIETLEPSQEPAANTEKRQPEDPASPGPSGKRQKRAILVSPVSPTSAPSSSPFKSTSPSASRRSSVELWRRRYRGHNL